MKDKRLEALLAQTDLKGWSEPHAPYELKDPAMQREALEDLRGEFYLCLEDCVRERNAERFERLLTKAERLTRYAAECGYDLLRPLNEHWASMLHQVLRARRRFLIRKWFVNPGSVNPEELNEALDLYPEDSPAHREDLERVRAKMANPSFRMNADVRAAGKAIALRPLHDQAYMRRLFGLDPV